MPQEYIHTMKPVNIANTARFAGPSAANTQTPISSDVVAIPVNLFAPISLAEMDSVALLDRIDTKYLLTHSQLLPVLASLTSQYRILEVNGNRINHYKTLYFDTMDFSCYRDHVNGMAERYKIRSREYTESNLSFLEIKQKTRKDRTVKERIRTEKPVKTLSANLNNWVNQILPLEDERFEPKLWNNFARITLVSPERCERVTIDTQLSFQSGSQRWNLDGIVVAEVKTDSSSQYSAFISEMRTRHIYPRSFSKYILGAARLFPQVKKNAIKPKLLLVEKMLNGAR
jgi:hypothetical protein